MATETGNAGADALSGDGNAGTGEGQGPEDRQGQDAAAGNEGGQGGQPGEGGRPGEGGPGESKSFFDGLEGEHLELVKRKAWDQDPNFGRDQLLEAYRNLESLKGSDVVSKPRLDDAEKRAEWFREHGGALPDAKQYAENIARPKLPEGMQYDEALEGKVYEAAAKAGVPAWAVGELYGVFAEHMGEAFSKAQGDAKEAEAAFQRDALTEWGGQKDQNIQMAGAAAQELVGEILGIKDAEGQGAVFEKLNGALGDFEVVKFFHGLARKMGNDKLETGGGSGFGQSPADARAELERLKGDKDFMAAVTDVSAQGHKDAVARWQRLHQQAAGA